MDNWVQVNFVEPKTEASTRTIQVADVVLDAITKARRDSGRTRPG